MQTIIGRLLKLAIATSLTVAVPLIATAPAVAGSNIANVDIVSEGIDLAPLYVGANANGYTSTEAASHKFMVQVYAKAAGQKKVWKVRISGNGNTLFLKDVGKSEGWDVYGKSHDVWAKPQSLQWSKYPIDACRDNMKALIASGKTKEQVLASDRKVSATAVIEFSAWADTKAHNKKDDHDGAGNKADMAMTQYHVQVICRAKL